MSTCQKMKVAIKSMCELMKTTWIWIWSVYLPLVANMFSCGIDWLILFVIMNPIVYCVTEHQESAKKPYDLFPLWKEGRGKAGQNTPPVPQPSLNGLSCCCLLCTVCSLSFVFNNNNVKTLYFISLWALWSFLLVCNLSTGGYSPFKYTRMSSHSV